MLGLTPVQQHSTRHIRIIAAPPIIDLNTISSPINYYMYRSSMHTRY